MLDLVDEVGEDVLSVSSYIQCQASEEIIDAKDSWAGLEHDLYGLRTVVQEASLVLWHCLDELKVSQASFPFMEIRLPNFDPTANESLPVGGSG